CRLSCRSSLHVPCRGENTRSKCPFKFDHNNDMEAKDQALTQKLDAYPPVFREPLKRLQNHGSVTLVVPPEKAYGSKGLPPKIPPGATMVYSVRIVDSQPEPAK
ncbi:FKBP-type peptidyl-prolyl cis-trans isomerase, partial [Klebsiella pneumoniae]|uniref:FKBP-type peptidyl-prolyl cis-trans isomerase n=1 Tax=Klebsiella pneumoniae TaxID=573 RepID=UPI0020CF3C94